MVLAVSHEFFLSYFLRDVWGLRFLPYRLRYLEHNYASFQKEISLSTTMVAAESSVGELMMMISGTGLVRTSSSVPSSVLIGRCEIMNFPRLKLPKYEKLRSPRRR